MNNTLLIASPFIFGMFTAFATRRNPATQKNDPIEQTLLAGAAIGVVLFLLGMVLMAL